MTYTPTTEQVREGFAQDPVAEYYNPLINHAQYGRKAFDRWLEAHDREVKAQALEEAAEDFNPEHFYHSPDGGDGHYLQSHQARYVQERLLNRAQQRKEEA